MRETRAVPAADRAAAALARTAGLSLPFDPGSYQGVHGPELDLLTDELEALLSELRDQGGDDATAAAVAARLGRCLALRFVLADAPGDRERALRLPEAARTSVTLGAENRETARRDLVTLLGSRMVRLTREAPAGLDASPVIDQLRYLFTVGAPLGHGGSGLVEDTGLLVRLLLEREPDGMTPELRAACAPWANCPRHWWAARRRRSSSRPGTWPAPCTATPCPPRSPPCCPCCSACWSSPPAPSRRRRRAPVTRRPTAPATSTRSGTH
ncbi:hypothetical protein ABZ299_06230 [Streptomyces sp. NPDC006184]|uniref:hypothetical protein n=1 Tax=Streptomyces sp. NPDC006184 TaxID=3155455 RepID=UPI0033A4E59D